MRTIAAERSGVSEGRTAQRMRARLVRYIYCYVPHAFTRCAALRQVCALVGDEGDATPFTREVTVEKVSTKLHDNGYQRRGNEALFHPPPRGALALARSLAPTILTRGRARPIPTAAMLPPRPPCRALPPVGCVAAPRLCAAAHTFRPQCPRGKCGAARGKWEPLGGSEGRSFIAKRVRSCTTDTPAGGCKRSSSSARRTTR